jgi:hypothetical protein
MMEVKIVDYGFSDDFGKNFITYRIKGLENEQLAKLQTRLEDPIVIRGDEIYLSTYFEKEFYPFHTTDAQNRMDDYVAREEIEMSAYILDLLEEN